jgi:hypothetical protein
MKMFPRRGAFRGGLLAVLAVFAAAAGACTFNSPFSPYSGVNLIAKRQFDASSAPWAASYSQTNAYPYITMTQVTAAVAGTTAGLPSDATGLFRLESPNLVTGGDMEAGVGGWSASNTTVGTTTTAPNAIDGTSLTFSFKQSYSTPPLIEFALDSALADGGVTDANYRINFDYNVYSTATTEFDYEDGSSTLLSTPWSLNTVGLDVTDMLHFPPEGLSSDIFWGPSAAHVFSIGRLSVDAVNTENGDLDNFRVVRDDIDSYFRLSVPYRDSGRPDLMTDGIYEFSVWVKLEDPASVTPNTANAFNATGITLGINDARKMFTINNAINAPTSPASTALTLTSTRWTKISMKAQIETSVPSNPSSTLVDLYIAPTNIYAKDAGSILVSTPTFELQPNG